MWQELFGNLAPIWDWVSDYAAFVSGVVIGMILMLLYHRLVGLRSLMASQKKVVDSLESHVKTLRVIVAKELNTITVEKKDKKFLKNLKSFF